MRPGDPWTTERYLSRGLPQRPRMEGTTEELLLVRNPRGGRLLIRAATWTQRLSSRVIITLRGLTKLLSSRRVKPCMIKQTTINDQRKIKVKIPENILKSRLNMIYWVFSRRTSRGYWLLIGQIISKIISPLPPFSSWNTIDIEY